MIIKTKNESELIDELAKLINDKSEEAITKNGSFKVGVSGGSLVKFLSVALQNVKSDLSKWIVFFCDERMVPSDSEDSTFGAYKKELKGKVNLNDDQFVQIMQGVTVEAAAEDYAKKLMKHFGEVSLPKFDMLMLGMGPDGHTCSLFPGHKLLEETEAWVAPIGDSPKPPPERITLTFPVINNAGCVVFAMAGASKAEMLRRILVEKEDLPATRVELSEGEVVWIVDTEAGKYLPPDHFTK
ncbi:PREDICTED: 6-phosphogluconolactonase [Nicrophorus vespilloides]|uniref:6-phosphogluconolactonase n=1 Tax=Nicrophorus vespilloides TaxID=110193 RepID=A0ABM1M7K3_NICVS|nr:PREDICTED: 6-phosphogluconolactonase [Nicrophorus vespilloides]